MNVPSPHLPAGSLDAGGGSASCFSTAWRSSTRSGRGRSCRSGRGASRGRLRRLVPVFGWETGELRQGARPPGTRRHGGGGRAGRAAASGGTRHARAHGRPRPSGLGPAPAPKGPAPDQASAPAPWSMRQRGCSPAGPRRRTGRCSTVWPRSTPPSTCGATSAGWTPATSSRPPASQLESTWRCTWWRAWPRRSGPPRCGAASSTDGRQGAGTRGPTPRGQPRPFGGSGRAPTVPISRPLCATLGPRWTWSLIRAPVRPGGTRMGSLVVNFGGPGGRRHGNLAKLGRGAQADHPAVLRRRQLRPPWGGGEPSAHLPWRLGCDLRLGSGNAAGGGRGR